jgi:outer membrane protein assembly factor BamE (lipoprotein component of BamABCDE complex)
MKVVKIIGWIVAVVIVLWAVGCGVSLYSISDSVNTEVEESEEASSRFERVRDQIVLGMTLDQVRSLAGPPQDKQHMKNEYGTSDYWYYGSVFGDAQVQLSFEDGVLKSINDY